MSKYEELQRDYKELCGIVKRTAAIFQLTGGGGTCVQLAQGVLETVKEMKTQEKETDRLRNENKLMEERVYATAGLLNVPDLSQSPLTVAENVEAAAQQMKRKVNELEKERDVLKRKLLQYEKSSLPVKHKRAQQEVEKERHRYNDLLGLRIRQDPRFQDLNDGGRPELVVRKFQDICNQERLDAADDLEDEGVTTDMETLELLSQVMQKSWEVAKSIIDEKQKKVSRVLKEEIASASRKQELVEIGEGLQLEILHELKTKDRGPFVSKICKEVKGFFMKRYPAFGREKRDVEKFTRACGEVSWMIVLVIPSMMLDTPAAGIYDPKRQVLYPECRVVEGAQITKCLWPALHFTLQQPPEVKAHVFTEIPAGRFCRKTFVGGNKSKWTDTLRSLPHGASKDTNVPSNTNEQQGNTPEPAAVAQGSKPESHVQGPKEKTKATEAANDLANLAISKPEKREGPPDKQTVELGAEETGSGSKQTSDKEGIDCAQAQLKVETQELNRVMEEKQRMHKELNTIIAKLERAKQELKTLTAETLSAKEEPQVDAHKEDEMKNQTTNYEFVKVKGEVEQAKKELESVTSQVQGATKKLDSLQQEIASTGDELSTRKFDVEAKKKELSDTRQESQAAREALQGIMYDRASTTEELSSVRSEVEVVKKQLTFIQTDIEKSQDLRSTLKKENEATKENINARKQGLEDVKKELDDANEKLAIAKEHLVSTESKIKAAKDEITALNRDIESTKQELDVTVHNAETVKQEQDKQHVAARTTRSVEKELADVTNESKSEAATQTLEYTQTVDDRSVSMPADSFSGDQMVSLSSTKGGSSAEQEKGDDPGVDDAQTDEEDDTRPELLVEDDFKHSIKHKVQEIHSAMERVLHELHGELAPKADDVRTFDPEKQREQGESLTLVAQLKKMQTDLEEIKSSPAIARGDDRTKLLTYIKRVENELKLQEAELKKNKKKVAKLKQEHGQHDRTCVRLDNDLKLQEAKVKENKKEVAQLKQDREEHEKNYVCVWKQSLATPHTTTETPSGVEMREPLRKDRDQKQRPDSTVPEVQLVVTKFRSLTEDLRRIALNSLEQSGVDKTEAASQLSTIMQVSVSMAKGVRDLNKTESDKQQQLEKQVTDHFSKREGAEKLGLLTDFLKDCVAVSLMMVDSSPQFELLIPTGGQFDDRIHESCNEAGASETHYVSQCLWPGLFLGPEDRPRCKAIVATFGSFLAN